MSTTTRRIPSGAVRRCGDVRTAVASGLRLLSADSLRNGETIVHVWAVCKIFRHWPLTWCTRGLEEHLTGTRCQVQRVYLGTGCEVLDTAASSQVEQRVGHQLHAIVPLLDVFKSE